MNHDLIRFFSKAKLDISEYGIVTVDEMDHRKTIHRFYTMSYVKEGHSEIRVNDKIYPVGPGTVILIPPLTPHDHMIPRPLATTFFWWHFTYKIYNTIDALSFIKYPIITVLERKINAFENVFKRIAVLSSPPKTISDIILREGRSLELLAYLFEQMLLDDYIKKSDIPEIFIHIFNDIAENLNGEISLQSLSKKYHMNGNYISNRFKQYFGVTPGQLRHEIIMDKARTLLSTTVMPVSDVAYQLGFKDLAAFTRFFTAKQGLPPSAYRELHI